MTSRQIKADKTRTKIYDCAMKLFRKSGYEAVKIIDICKAADVSVGTFYYYFKSKEDIVGSGAIHHYEALLTALGSYTPVDDPIENIRYYAKSQVSAVMEFSSDLTFIYSYRLLQASTGAFSIRQATQKYLPAVTFLRKQVQEAIDRGLFRNDIPAEDIVSAIRRQARGVSYDWCLHRYEYDLIATRMFDLELLFDALRVKK